MGDRASEFGEDLGVWTGAFIPAEHWHFHRRVFERYRTVLPPGAFSKMLRRLRAGPSKDALRISRNILTGREVWGVYVPDGRVQRLLYVVWLPRRQAVITALPPSAWGYAKRQRAKEELKEFRQRRRLPFPLRVPGVPALLCKIARAIEPLSRAALRLGIAPNVSRRLLECPSGNHTPFLTFEITVERDREDPRPVPLGWNAGRLRETVFYLKAVVFRPASRSG